MFVWLSYSLYHQIQHQENLRAALLELIAHWDVAKILLVVAVILLMLANWSVESIKWSLLLRDTENLSFMRSFQSVLTGLAISIITPNRIGEYLGRILYLKNTNKLKGISITIVGSFAQILVTSFFGILGLAFYLINVEATRFLIVLLIGSLFISVILFYLLFHLEILINFCERHTFLRKLKLYIEVLKKYDASLLWRLILYAALRYLIYSVQFYLLLRITHGWFLPMEAFAGIWLNFWVIAVVPSFAIADVGVRGKTAVMFLSYVSTNVIALLSSSILLWFINLIIPSLIGCFFVYRIKMLDNE